MKLPLHIVFLGMKPSEAVEAAASEKAHKLNRFSPDIMSCRVEIELSQKHQHQGQPYAVRIHLTLPGHELTVDRVQDEDVYVALREAFDRMKRQIEETVRQTRGLEKQHAQPLHGEIVRLEADLQRGFIRTADGDEYYFDRENLADTPFEHLELGHLAQFLPDVGSQGRQAKRVSFGKHRFT